MALGRPSQWCPTQSMLASALILTAMISMVVGEPRIYAGEPDGWRPHRPRPGAPKPFPPKNQKHLDPNTLLFVGTASFRDDRCGRTLFNLFTKAMYPDRLRIGVVQQNSVHEKDCVAYYCELMYTEKGPHPRGSGRADANCPYIQHIRIRRLKHTEAKGPCLGRAIVHQELLQEEEFCMQIDSHMDVVKNWDMEMMKEWGAAENEYGVLTTYVVRTEWLSDGQPHDCDLPHLCIAFFTGSGMVRNEQAKSACQIKKPLLAPLWAAGLSFSRCHADRRVPYDPKLDYIFDGEEFSRAARLWTHGYDFYSPSRNLIAHDYKPGSRVRLTWGVGRNVAEEAAAQRRLATLWEFPDSDQSANAKSALRPYNLGSYRTLDQFIKFTGVDTKRKQNSGNSRCTTLEWVPFKENVQDLTADVYAQGGGKRPPPPPNADPILVKGVAKLPPPPPVAAGPARRGGGGGGVEQQADVKALRESVSKWSSEARELWDQNKKLSSVVSALRAEHGKITAKLTRLEQVVLKAPTTEQPEDDVVILPVPLIAGVGMLGLGVLLFVARRYSRGKPGKGA